VSSFRHEVRRTLVPGVDQRHGPLAPMLVGLTVVTGLVDAFSYLELGHVFTANMTGNVVVLAFALAGAKGFSIGASVSALAAFWVGAFLGGRLAGRFGSHRGELLSIAVFVQSACFSAAVIINLLNRHPLPAGGRYPLVVLLAVAMGIQNATVRRLAVPGLTTTVLTLTITGAAVDTATTADEKPSPVRSYISVLALFLGALAGAILERRVSTSIPLIAALVMAIAVGLAARRASKPDSPWREA
jgi:uncharacterized membrane protein YoaK (UPF0700 family)